MVATISIEDLRLKLNHIFCVENKLNKKYSKVWLSEADFGGVYHSDKHIINVKAEHYINSCNNEIKHISSILFQNLQEDERSMIWRIVVYNSNEEIQCFSEDILVYDISTSC
jgi:hypothetical protein